jgi:hypothetical protein
MATKPKTVKVQIRAKQVVIYSQVVEMTQADFDKINEKVGKDYAEHVAMLLNLHDIDDAFEMDEDDIDEFAILAPVKPKRAKT